MRTAARETVFKYLFSKLFNQDDKELFVVLCKNEMLKEEDFKFASALLNAVESSYDRYYDIMSELSVGFKAERIFNADKCAIIIGMAELENFDTPYIVAIDQAVGLSSKYSTEKSANFVNGILASYYNRIKG